MLDEARSFGRFLRRSLRALADETPEIESRFRRRLSGHRVLIEVDGETIRLDFAAIHDEAEANADLAAIFVRTTRATILDLVEAAMTLPEAIVSGRLGVRGRPADLLDFFDGLELYLHGAVRAPTFRQLLEEYR